MKRLIYFMGLLCMILVTACSDNEVAPKITLSDESSQTIAFNSESADSVTVTFSSTKDWTAVSTATWLSVTPRSGTAGNNCTITIAVKEDNLTSSLRTGYVTLASDGTTMATLTVTQDVHEEYFAQFEQDVYLIPAEGSEAYKFVFKSNAALEDMGFARSWDADWIHFPKSNSDDDTRAVKAWQLTLTIDPNTSESPRAANFYITRYTSDTEYEYIGTVRIVQEGVGGSTSTDFSDDGKVRVIQTHSVGNGVPLVFIGDGFIDEEVTSGWYSQAINKATEHFFSEEPIKSLRDYFDIYEVTAVSKHNFFEEGFETAISCDIARDGTTTIEGDDEAILDYLDNIPDLDVVRTQVVVILNSTEYAGTTFFGYHDGNGNIIDYSVAYCPMINGIDDDQFRQVLVHESVGHGFGKLDDEYYYEEMGTIPDDAKEEIKSYHLMGWLANTDITSNPNEVIWSQFLSDSRYADQGLGVFEGAATYIYGAYRPTEQSMMNENIEGFNAPSRQALYNRVIRDATGVEPSYEDFVAYDLAHPYRATTDTKAVQRPNKRSHLLPRPKFVNKQIIRK